MAKQTITNVSDGPKIVNAAPPFTLQAGESADGVDLTPDELASAKTTGWFEFGAKAAKEAAKDADTPTT